MLRQQETVVPASFPPPAATAEETRVTAEELAEALSAIETRRAERARGMEGTLPIGEAIRQLDLEASPDEILAEVQARRSRQAQQAQAAALRGPQRRRGWLALLALPPAFLSMILILYLGRSASVIAPPAVAQVAQVDSPVPALGQDIQVVDETGGRQVVRMLAEIGDGRPVRCDWNDAVRLLPGGAEIQKGMGNLTPEQGASKHWRLIKFGGKLYLRGWLALPMSETALRSAPVILYSTPPAPEEAAKITLPVETSRFQGGSVGSEPEQIRLSVPVLDEHVRDQW